MSMEDTNDVHAAIQQNRMNIGALATLPRGSAKIGRFLRGASEHTHTSLLCSPRAADPPHTLLPTLRPRAELLPYLENYVDYQVRSPPRPCFCSGPRATCALGRPSAPAQRARAVTLVCNEYARCGAAHADVVVAVRRSRSRFMTWRRTSLS